MFKILWKILKLFVVLYLVLLVLRPESAEKLIDCDVSDGSISVAGSEIPIDGEMLIDAYSGIEEKASSLIPSGVRRIISGVSDWLGGLLFFGDAPEG